MKQEVQSKSEKKKKLFEWDRSNRLMALRIKQTEYLLELAEDNTFVCIDEKGREKERQTK